MIMPVGMSLLAQTAGPSRVGRVMSVVGVPMLLGPILGPVIGGVIVDSGASSSRERVSSATLTIVVSRIDMITPTITTLATSQTSRPRGSVSGVLRSTY